MNKIFCSTKLPNNNQYVLAHLNIDNWRDRDDTENNRYWVVVKFVRGISKAERAILSDDNPRKNLYQSGDEWDNNKMPYYWTPFGAGSFWGQEVDYWCELPK